MILTRRHTVGQFDEITLHALPFCPKAGGNIEVNFNGSPLKLYIYIHIYICIYVYIYMRESTGLANMAQDFWYDTLWHSNNSRNIPLRKPLTWEPKKDLTDYRWVAGWYDCHFGLRWQFSYIDNSQLNAINTNATYCLWGKCENQHPSTPVKTADWDGIKVMVDRKRCLKATGCLLCIPKGFCGGRHRFPPAVRQNSSTGRMIPWNWPGAHLIA